MRNGIILTTMMFLCLASFSAADMVIETKTELDMIGAGKVDMEQTQYIKGDRSYDENTTRLNEQMAAMAGKKDMRNIQIVRLDKGIGWALDPDAKSYNEFSFEQLKANLEMALKQQKSAAPMGEYEWTNEISKDIGTEKIMSYDCKGIRAISVGVNKNDVKDSIFITNEQWFAKDLPGGSEFTNFSDKMSEAVGNKKGLLNQMSMNPMLAKFGDQFGEIAKEFETVEGIPLKTVLVVEGTINPMGAAMEGKEIDEEARAMMEKMGIAMPDAAPEGGHHNLISLTSTVTKIEEHPIDDSKYEIPEGYKKQ